MIYHTGNCIPLKMLIILQGIATVVDNDTTLIRASDLWNNYLQLKDMDLFPVWSGMLDIFSEINV